MKANIVTPPAKITIFIATILSESNTSLEVVIGPNESAA